MDPDVNNTRPDPKSPFHRLFNRIPGTRPAKTPAIRKLYDELIDMRGFEPGDLTTYEAWANLSYTCQIWRPLLKSNLNDRICQSIDSYFEILKDIQSTPDNHGTQDPLKAQQMTDHLANMMTFALARVCPINHPLLLRCYRHMDDIGVDIRDLEKKILKNVLRFPQTDISDDAYKAICELTGDKFTKKWRGQLYKRDEIEKQLEDFIDRANEDDRTALYEIIISDRLKRQLASDDSIQAEKHFTGHSVLEERNKLTVRDRLFLTDLLNALRGEAKDGHCFEGCETRSQILKAVNLAYEVPGLSDINHPKFETAREFEKNLPAIDVRLLDSAQQTLEAASRRASQRNIIDHDGYEFLQDHTP